ncbi:hypothetical protein OHC33_004849 [Knufia fluminis]|uniref:Uncharacterized protein n=1 Tax=Knufia fluminis TaxID=191047 RepID=A0AAN8I897_9EURO|nr:hypothetical protein OHC33_004849 [Knufia fluminis]
MSGNIDKEVPLLKQNIEASGEGESTQQPKIDSKLGNVLAFGNAKRCADEFEANTGEGGGDSDGSAALPDAFPFTLAEDNFATHIQTDVYVRELNTNARNPDHNRIIRYDELVQHEAFQDQVIDKTLTLRGGFRTQDELASSEDDPEEPVPSPPRDWSVGNDSIPFTPPRHGDDNGTAVLEEQGTVSGAEQPASSEGITATETEAYNERLDRDLVEFATKHARQVAEQKWEVERVARSALQADIESAIEAIERQKSENQDPDVPDERGLTRLQRFQLGQNNYMEYYGELSSPEIAIRKDEHKMAEDEAWVAQMWFEKLEACTFPLDDSEIYWHLWSWEFRESVREAGVHELLTKLIRRNTDVAREARSIAMQPRPQVDGTSSPPLADQEPSRQPLASVSTSSAAPSFSFNPTTAPFQPLPTTRPPGRLPSTSEIVPITTTRTGPLIVDSSDIAPPISSSSTFSQPSPAMHSPQQYFLDPISQSSFYSQTPNTVFPLQSFVQNPGFPDIAQFATERGGPNFHSTDRQTFPVPGQILRGAGPNRRYDRTTPSGEEVSGSIRGVRAWEGELPAREHGASDLERSANDARVGTSRDGSQAVVRGHAGRPNEQAPHIIADVALTDQRDTTQETARNVQRHVLEFTQSLTSLRQAEHQSNMLRSAQPDTESLQQDEPTAAQAVEQDESDVGDESSHAKPSGIRGGAGQQSDLDLPKVEPTNLSSGQPDNAPQSDTPTLTLVNPGHGCSEPPSDLTGEVRAEGQSSSPLAASGCVINRNDGANATTNLTPLAERPPKDQAKIQLARDKGWVITGIGEPTQEPNDTSNNEIPGWLERAREYEWKEEYGELKSPTHEYCKYGIEDHCYARSRRKVIVAAVNAIMADREVTEADAQAFNAWQASIAAGETVTRKVELSVLEERERASGANPAPKSTVPLGQFEELLESYGTAAAEHATAVRRAREARRLAEWDWKVFDQLKGKTMDELGYVGHLSPPVTREVLDGMVSELVSMTGYKEDGVKTLIDQVDRHGWIRDGREEPGSPSVSSEGDSDTDEARRISPMKRYKPLDTARRSW